MTILDERPDEALRSAVEAAVPILSRRPHFTITEEE